MSTKGRPPKFQSPSIFEAETEAYFKNCKANNKIPTKTGLALYLGTTAETLGRYEDKPRFSPIIKKAYDTIIEEWVQAAKRGEGVNPIFAMFYLKARHGWEDKQSVQLSGGLSLSELFERSKRK